MVQPQLNGSSNLSLKQKKMTKREKQKFWKDWEMAIKLYAILLGFAVIASMDELIRRFT